jgi:hypothetical protein
MNKPIASLCIILAAVASGAKALDFDFSLSANAGTETKNALYPELDIKASHQNSGFSFLWDVGMDGSGRYGSLFGNAFGFGTVIVKEGGMTWDNGGSISASLGKLALRDEIETPYSLALSSLGNSALTMSFRYEDDRFFFSDHWFALNYDSAGTFLAGDGTAGTPLAWPDRSAVVKSYGFKTGDVRWGFQDIIIYTNLDYGSGGSRGPLIDLEYFINPAPAFLIQYANTSLDAPWRKSGSLNDNSLMGFFGTWKRDNMVFDAQFLVDDFNMNRFLHPHAYQNPDKIAWTIGGSMETEYGSFRFDHAGATQYTFATSGGGGQDNLAYGYTYYPDTEFTMGGVYQAIDPETNYVGYLHGENNLAFMASWKNKFEAFTASSSLELTLSGSKSPANSWGPLTSFPDGTHLLDESPIEKKLVLAAQVDYPWKDFIFFASGKLGFVWNRLKLTAVSGAKPRSIDNGIPYYKPSDENGIIATLTLGGTWSLKN